MVETEQTLAERGLEKRNSASQLLEGETFLKSYTYRNTVVFTFPNGSIRVRSSDGPLGLVTPYDSVNLLSESALRGFLA